MGQHHHLYNNSRWLARRKQQLSAHPLCALCLARGVVTAATVADHVVPHSGDVHLFWYGKLQSLCKLCHDSAKRHEEAFGYSKGTGIDGFPLEQHPEQKK